MRAERLLHDDLRFDDIDLFHELGEITVRHVLHFVEYAEDVLRCPVVFRDVNQTYLVQREFCAIEVPEHPCARGDHKDIHTGVVGSNASRSTYGGHSSYVQWSEYNMNPACGRVHRTNLGCAT